MCLSCVKAPVSAAIVASVSFCSSTWSLGAIMGSRPMEKTNKKPSGIVLCKLETWLQGLLIILVLTILLIFLYYLFLSSSVYHLPPTSSRLESLLWSSCNLNLHFQFLKTMQARKVCFIFFFWLLHFGVTTADHLPQPPPISSSVKATIFMSSFTTSINKEKLAI